MRWDKTRPWFDTIGHAIKTYDSIRLNDPTGPRADDAIMATANIYFRYGKYEEADYHYTLLRKEYPRSELQFEAHLLGLQAKLRKYQGENYDGTPLEEAKVLVKQLNSQFGGRLAPKKRRNDWHRLGPAEAGNRQPRLPHGRLLRLQRGLRRGQTLLRRGYREVSGHRLFAKIAKDRVAEIKGEPENPTKTLAFLVDLLPENRERTRVARIPELQKGGSLTTAAAPGQSAETGRGQRNRVAARRRRPSNGMSFSAPLATLRVRVAQDAVCESQVACALCVALPAASATNGGTDSLYAADIATVYVPMIESDSYRRDLGERLTEAVVKEIELKTPYKVVSTPNADSISRPD